MVDRRPTSWAATQLGTSTTTVRSLVTTGALSGRVEQRAERRRWAVDVDSVERYLREHGRVDLQLAKRRRTGRNGELLSRVDALSAEVAALRQQLEATSIVRGAPQSDDADLARARAEVAALRGALLELRARQAAVDEAVAAEQVVVERLQATIAAQRDMIHHLRRALIATDAAVGQFVVPGVPEF